MNLENARVLLRVDFNVPIKGGSVIDDFRIRATLQTILSLLKKGCRIFLISHLENNGKISRLDPVKKTLEKFLNFKIGFVSGKLPKKPTRFSERVVLFDNIRLNPGEKQNDGVFTRNLASWGNRYINEAFAASHRKHASIVGLPGLLPHSAGCLFKKEVKNLSSFFKPKHPFLLILGGKKFSTKEPLICRFLKNADAIFVGGALGNTFLSQRGFSVGKSKIENVKIPKNILWSPKIFLPEDVIVLRNGKKKSVLLRDVKSSDIIYDAGPKTIGALAKLAKNSKSVLWNGTLGICENGFDYGTKKLGMALGKSDAFKVVGGGDTVAAIRKMKLEKNFDFISTGGGAMLEFLATGTLPGIEALKD